MQNNRQTILGESFIVRDLEGFPKLIAPSTQQTLSRQQIREWVVASQFTIPQYIIPQYHNTMWSSSQPSTQQTLSRQGVEERGLYLPTNLQIQNANKKYKYSGFPSNITPADPLQSPDSRDEWDRILTFLHCAFSNVFPSNITPPIAVTTGIN